MEAVVIILAAMLGASTGTAVYFWFRATSYRNDYESIWKRCNQDVAELHSEIDRLTKQNQNDNSV
jgi:hypothetical protein